MQKSNNDKNINPFSLKTPRSVQISANVCLNISMKFALPINILYEIRLQVWMRVQNIMAWVNNFSWHVLAGRIARQGNLLTQSQFIKPGKG